MKTLYYRLNADSTDRFGWHLLPVVVAFIAPSRIYARPAVYRTAGFSTLIGSWRYFD